jgi:hypothetical protein
MAVKHNSETNSCNIRYKILADSIQVLMEYVEGYHYGYIYTRSFYGPRNQKVSVSGQHSVILYFGILLHWGITLIC